MHEDRWMDRSINLSRYKRDSVLVGLNVTSHTLAHLAIASRSMFSYCAVTSQFSTIRFKLVSSAKSRIFAWILIMMSLI